MALKLYNSKTKDKHIFKPLKDNEVSMYVCGITPQNSAHIGHAVSALRFAVVRRYLEFKGYNVNYVHNVTDIDDKIIARSHELGVSPGELAIKHTDEYFDGLSRAGVPMPTHIPRVSEYVQQIIKYIEELIKNGHAYATNSGDVYFEVATLPEYGSLSGRKTDDALAGHRIENKLDKKSEQDFALWKSDSEHGWESPWGLGRPGWHIECSVMCDSLLGQQIDIHGGGLDLLFPHHENENAQCKAHNGTSFVNFWMHSGLLNINGTKMSKSLGNFITLGDALDKYGPELINMVILRHQYRSGIDMTDELFSQNLNTLLTWTRAVESVPDWRSVTKQQIEESDNAQDIIARFTEAMDDDIHTPRALVGISPYLEDIDSIPAEDRPVIIAVILQLLNILGLFIDFNAQSSIENLLSYHQSVLSPNNPIKLSEINDILDQRALARESKNYELSDTLRDTLAAHKIKTIDNRDGLSWEFDINK